MIKNNLMKAVVVMMLCTGSLSICMKCPAQSQETKQLILDIRKLIQLKKILKNMYQSYKVLRTGYNKVTAVTSGNFSLHEAFLDGLMQVSPRVRNYQKIAAIIQDEKYLLSEYKNVFNRLKQNELFTAGELSYMSAIYQNLINESVQNMSELFMVITAGKLRMSDGERLSAIDRLYADTQKKLSFLRSFNRKAFQVADQRKRLLKNNQKLNSIYGIQK